MAFEFSSLPVVVTAAPLNGSDALATEKLSLFKRFRTKCIIIKEETTKERALDFEEPLSNYNIVHQDLNFDSLTINYLFDRYLEKNINHQIKKSFLEYQKFELLYRVSISQPSHLHFFWIDYDFPWSLLENGLIKNNFIWPKALPDTISNALQFSAGPKFYEIFASEKLETEKEIDLYLSIFLMDRETIKKVYFGIKDKLVKKLYNKQFISADRNLYEELKTKEDYSYLSVSVDPKTIIGGSELFFNYLIDRNK
jgi:hypothetical protein